MRPQKLSLTGFRSYPRDRAVTIDFTGKGVIATLGDTGAGKSSLFEAIIYALFRRSTWGNPGVLIADSAEQMTVTFEFLHDGHCWRVSRTMHASNNNLGLHHLINLDTNEEADGARAVDARIRALLQMGYETFERVGLLPQGKFDQLLTENESDRTKRLRELFGTDSLDSVRHMASTLGSTLSEQIKVAQVKREAMGCPTQVASERAADADAAEARAARLTTAIATIAGLHKRIAAANSDLAKTAAVAARLDHSSVLNATTTLDKLESTNADVDIRAAALQQRAEQVEADEKAFAAQLAAIEGGKESRAALNKAAAVVERLAARASEHRDERDRLFDLARELDDERARIDVADTELQQRLEQGQPLTDSAQAASAATTKLREHARDVSTRTRRAVDLARQAASAVRAHAAAVSALEQAQDAVEAPRAAVSETTTNSDNAAARLEAALLSDRGAAIAIELCPGETCPVCSQEILAEFTPRITECADELREAKKLERAAKIAHERARSALANAHLAVTAAKNTVVERDQQLPAVQLDAQQCIDALHQHLADFTDRAKDAGESFDHEAASEMLNTAADYFSSQTGDIACDSEVLVEPVVSALSACVASAATRSEQLQAEAVAHRATIKAESNALDGRRLALQKQVEDAEKANERHGRSMRATAADIGSLPPRIQSMLPAEVLEIDEDAVATASAALTARLDVIHALSRQHDEARSERETVQALRHELQHERRTQVVEPLADLRRELEDWAAAAEAANAHLTAASQQEIPTLPDKPAIGEIRQCATELAAVTLTLGKALTIRTSACTTELETATQQLHTCAVTLPDLDGFDPAGDLADSAILQPLFEAKATATAEAKHMRDEQHKAQGQIKPADHLDIAIEAGLVRQQAYEVLRTELAEGKFLKHLTNLNTHALLGVASELLGRMTDQRFGFAADFGIVSRNGNDVVHSVNRLSGGEKFLASLALALALAELHSYSGPRLGALFLDEGFAALDTATLDSALDVLRTQTDGNRLVMVISHLHAVAEAVDEVLWVERGATGSSARWLTPSERAQLINADLASGLQGLT